VRVSVRSSAVNRYRVLILAIFCLVASTFTGRASADELGVGLQILPEPSNSVAGAITNNNKLWFALQKGQKVDRRIQITGSKYSDVRATLELFAAQRVNDELTFSEELSTANDWISFSENNFIVKKGEQKMVTVTMTIPDDQADQTLEAYLGLTVESTSPHPAVGSGGAAVPQIARVAQPVFIAVGEADALKVDFDIKSVRGMLLGNQKYLVIEIRNNGRTPIDPNGIVQLKNLDFESTTLGPYKYFVPSIPPTTTANVQVAVPDEVLEGKYRIFVSARQGYLIIERQFDVDLEFREMATIAWEYVLPFVAGIALLFYALRSWRSPRRKSRMGMR
jgi:hypothetical protein